MRINSITLGAVLGALAVSSVSVFTAAAASPSMNLKALAANPKSSAHFTLYLPLTHTDELEQLLKDQTDATAANYHHWLTPAQFKQQFGPDRLAVAKATAILRAAGLSVVGEKTQNLEVEGSVAAVEKALAVHLQQIPSAEGTMTLGAAERHITLPDGLRALGAIVPEFVPLREAHVHSSRGRQITSSNPAERLSDSNSGFYPNDLNQAYLLPSFETQATPKGGSGPVQIAGVGAHIGILISSIILPSDLHKTFNSVVDFTSGGKETQDYSGFSNLPVPNVAIRTVNGGSGPFNPNADAGFEASLDTQMSLGTAPGATETLYDIPNLADANIVSGYQAIVEDNVVDVVSSSFGECELYYTAAYNDGTDLTYILKAYHNLFVQGNAQGITFLASSGDNGARECFQASLTTNPVNGTNFILGVSSPANDPNVTAVGGTNLQTTATPYVDDATYAGENANYDPTEPASFTFGSTTVTVGNNTWGSGGGFSTLYAKPSYQSLVSTGSSTQRAMPDIALMMGGCPSDADLSVQDCTTLPRSFVLLWFAGGLYSVIGTSSSSPEMAGVMALAIELNGGRLGNVNPMIYALSKAQTQAGGVKAPAAKQYFHLDITGDNNGYTVKPGQAFSEVLGTGTLNVKTFLDLQSAAAANAPNTPSNP